VIPRADGASSLGDLLSLRSQDPATSGYGDIARAALRSGAVDRVLSLDGIVVGRSTTVVADAVLDLWGSSALLARLT
jgi:hypothetical protein